MTWGKKDLERLQADGKIRGFTEADTVKASKICTAKQPKICKQPKPLLEIIRLLDAAGIPYETEYVFAPGRKFRFDIALPDRKIAIEYEGLMSKKSRHTTVTGYTKDATKYNLAQSLGWQVYRYTTLNYKDFENDLKNIIQ